MIKNTKNRSGVTLLFVISMIVLFLLMGSSFVVMTSQFRRSSDDNARVATRRDDARTLVNRAFYDLFRGPSLSDEFSPLRGHSILGDQYGYGIKSFVRGSTAVPGTRGQLLQLTLDVNGDPTDGEQYQDILTGLQADFSNQGGTYDGQVLTFTTGAAEGISTRIVSYQVEISGGTVSGHNFIITPEWDDSNQLTLAALVNSEVLINGRPFVGSGAGFFVAGVPSDRPALNSNAYDVNQVGVSRANFVSGYLGTNRPLVGTSGNQASVNEDYDIPDYQNVFLAAVGPGRLGPGGIVGPSVVISRSFDRPQLRAHVGGNNPRTNFRAENTGEVDNDGDGVNDGIWIDIGLPVQTDARGRVYKPLVSYLVVDMDGKINVNAHSQIADLTPNGLVTNRVEMLNGETPVNFGRGFGPAEIGMNSLFSAPEMVSLISGRYGIDGRPGLPQPQDDILSVDKWFSHPTANIIGDPSGRNGGLFGSPLDAMGRFATGTPNFQVTGLRVDPFDSRSRRSPLPAGLPVVDWTPNSADWPSIGGDELSDNPYEMSFRREANAATEGGIDTPYDAREMERVLRRFDSDTKMLPSRLREFTSSSLAVDPSLRFAFTQAAWEVPVPPSNVVTDLRNRLISQTGGVSEVFLNENVLTMLSPDLIHGLKMDPNRAFGNGVDDDGDRIVDQVWLNGATIAETETIVQAAPGGTVTVDFDHDGFNLDPNRDANVSPQQIFARHLYVLTLLMTEIDHNGDGFLTHLIGTSTMERSAEIRRSKTSMPTEQILHSGRSTWLTFAIAIRLCIRLNLILNRLMVGT